MLLNLKSPKRLIIAASFLWFGLAAAAAISTGPLHKYAVAVVILIMTLVIIRHVFLFVLALLDRHRRASMEIFPEVSVIMPSYNEAKVIEPALISLVALDYPNIEIIVVDDGSTDNTLQLARDFIEANKIEKILLLSQSNSGKACALNTGIKHARGEFVLCVDSDSRLNPAAIRHALSHFTDPTVAAVGGAVEISNNTSLLAQMQALEYRTSLNFTRRALSYLGAVTVVPGPIGMFRREVLLTMGGYDERRDVFAEDADLTVRLLSAGWKIRGDMSMISYTEAPESVFALLRQRYRWKRGLFQAFDTNYFALLIAPGWRGVAIALFLALECFVLDILNFSLIVFFLFYVIFHGGVSPMLSAYLLLLGLDLSVLWFVHRGTSNLLTTMGLLLLQRFTYSQVLQVWAVFALLDEWRSTQMDWDKLERIGKPA